MKKILYFTEWELKDSDGITKKILSQVKYMKKNNETDLFVLNGNEININGTITKQSSKLSSYFKLFKYIKNKGVDLVYVRNLGGSSVIYFLIISFLLRKQNIYIEIPTYPFEGESGEGNSLRKKIIESVRFFYRFTINKIIYIGERTSAIWGVPAVQIDNGIEVDAYRMVNRDPKLVDVIEFIGVASLANWHGYDRLIKAINESDDKFVFNIVGEGPELDVLKRMVHEDKKDSVIFHGFKDGERLDAIFERSHIAVDSLARHRTGIKQNSSLKSKEYAARGIPFIKSHLDPCFSSCDFVFDVTPDEDSINLNLIKSWYAKLDDEPKYIRNFAKKNLTWDKQLEKIGL